MTTRTGEPSTARPKASFVIITLNHVAFIRRCLDAVLAQEVDFSYEVVVHDDGSTDGTVDVLRGYAAAHPGTFRLLLQQYSEGSAGAAMLRALSAATGEYVLFCDGDDFWDDAKKAATQVALLDSRPDLGFCFHEVHRCNADETFAYSMIEDVWLRDWTSEEIARTSFVYLPEQTLAFRNVHRPYPPELASALMCDLFLTRLVAHGGDGAYVGDRVRPTQSFLHPGGTNSAVSPARRDRMARVTYLAMVAWLLRVGRDDEAEVLIHGDLISRLLGRLGPPPPRVTWRHPGSVVLALRHRRTWGGSGRVRRTNRVATSSSGG